MEFTSARPSRATAPSLQQQLSAARRVLDEAVIGAADTRADEQVITERARHLQWFVLPSQVRLGIPLARYPIGSVSHWLGIPLAAMTIRCPHSNTGLYMSAHASSLSLIYVEAHPSMLYSKRLPYTLPS